MYNHYFNLHYIIQFNCIESILTRKHNYIKEAEEPPGQRWHFHLPTHFLVAIKASMSYSFNTFQISHERGHINSCILPLWLFRQWFGGTQHNLIHNLSTVPHINNSGEVLVISGDPTTLNQVLPMH